MPGGSPNFPTEESIEHLYEDLYVLFSRVAKNFQGATLTEYHDWFRVRCAREREARPPQVAPGASGRAQPIS
jgi:hypothetical protein